MQKVATRTIKGSAVDVPIATLGRSTLTYFARDVAGNRAVKLSERIFVGQTLTCAGAMPSVSLPDRGTLLINDRILSFD